MVEKSTSVLVAIKQLSWGLVVLWTIATGIGWAVLWSPRLFVGLGTAILHEVVIASGDNPTPISVYLIGGALVGIVHGSIFGLGQWLVLRKRVSRAHWWFFATFI